MLLRTQLMAALLLATLAGPALADRVELTTGASIEGSVLAAGPERVVVDGPQGITFLERAQVRCVLDGLGQLLPLPNGEADPVGVVKVVEGGVRVQRRDVDVILSIHGSQAVVLEADVLRTTPYGRVTLVVAGGASVSARADAVMRFRQGTPELVEGTLRVEHEAGTARVLIPEGRLVVTEGRAQVEHVRGRSRLICVSGRTVLQATDGYTLELPRNHAVDVKSQRDGEPASIAGSNANAWPVRLEHGTQSVSIQPGERIVLLGPAPRATEPEPPARPAPRQEPLPRVERLEPERPLTPPPPATPTTGVGTIVRSAAKVQLDRAGDASRRIEAAEAEGFSLWPGDTLLTDTGDLWLEANGGRVHVSASSRVGLRPVEGGPAFRLTGEATFETDGQLSVGVTGGEVGLLRGSMVLSTNEQSVDLRVAAGTAGARFGDDVRAELLAPSQVRATLEPRGRVRLSVPPDGQAVEVTAGTLDARVAAQRWVAHHRTGDLQTIELWNGARLELLGQVRARIVPGPSETDLLDVPGAGQFPLVAGTYRFSHDAAGIHVLGLPPEVAQALARAQTGQPPAPTKPATATTPTPVAGSETLTLKNGAVVVTRAWGPVRVLRDGLQDVELEGPNGSVFLGPNTRATLSRQNGMARIETGDGRFVDHEVDAGPFDLWLNADGRLRVTVRGEALPRSIEVEPGCSFDLTIRRDRYVLANVFGQVVYVDLGQQVSVTRRSGLRVRPGR